MEYGLKGIYHVIPTSDHSPPFNDPSALFTSSLSKQKPKEKSQKEKRREKKTTKMPLTPHARSTYRALLREHPRRSLPKSTTTPLHARLRDHFRTTAATPQFTNVATNPNTSETEEWEKMKGRVQEAEQLAVYVRAQRTYKALVERYNPGMGMDEEERVRLTARRVGWDLPVVGGDGGKE